MAGNWMRLQPLWVGRSSWHFSLPCTCAGVTTQRSKMLTINLLRIQPFFSKTGKSGGKPAASAVSPVFAATNPLRSSREGDFAVQKNSTGRAACTPGLAGTGNDVAKAEEETAAPTPTADAEAEQSARKEPVAARSDSDEPLAADVDDTTHPAAADAAGEEEKETEWTEEAIAAYYAEHPEEEQ